MSRPKLPGLSDAEKDSLLFDITEAKSVCVAIDAAADNPNVTRIDARRLGQLSDGIHARLTQIEAWVTTGNWIGEANPKPEQGNG